MRSALGPCRVLPESPLARWQSTPHTANEVALPDRERPSGPECEDRASRTFWGWFPPRF